MAGGRASNPEDIVSEETEAAAAAEPAPEPAPEPAVEPATQAPSGAPTVAAPADPTEVPVTPTPAATTPAPEAAAATPAPASRNGFFIPRWVGFVALAIVGILIVGGIGYAIGHDNASSGGRSAGANFPGNGNLPGNGNSNGGRTFPGNGNSNGGQTFPGNGNSNGGGGTSQSGAFLGVAIQDPASGSGAEITTVQDGSPATKAGLQVGDVITKVDTDQIADAAALAPAIRAHASGDTVTVTYTRNGTTSTVDVTLGSAATRTQPN
jgi:membrane-associated protease RseP (regulator of RpoE activity)